MRTTGRRPRTIVLLAAVLSCVLSGVPVALAADVAAEALVQSSSVDGSRLELLLDDRRPDASAPAGDVVVRVDGSTVPFEVTALTGPAQLPEARTAVLLVDTSGSMQGPGITGARAAAQAYLDAVPADVRVGLTTFSGEVRTVVPPTADRALLSRAVAGLTASGRTALNDGVLEALRVLGPEGDRRLLLLSDGADSASASSLVQVLSQTAASKVQLVAVAFGTDQSAHHALAQLAAQGQGQVVRAGDAAALTQAFRGVAEEYSGTLRVQAQLPDSVSGRVVEVRVEVRRGAEVTTDRVELSVPSFASLRVEPADAPAAAAPVRSGWFGSRASLPWAFGSLFLGLLVLLVTAVGTGDSRAEASRRTRQVMARYTLTPSTEQVAAPGALGEGAVARSALELAGRAVQRPGVRERLALRLEHADVPLKAEEWVLLRFVAASTGGALLFLLVDPAWLGLLVGVALGLASTKAYLSVRTRRRRAAFLEALPDALQLVAGALSSGFSLPQAMDTVVRDGSEPMAGEIGRALAEASLGVPLEDALDAVALRMDCEDFRWVVMAVRVQREIGGNLAGVLTTVTNTLRERSRLRRQVQSLSAEGRMSAWVLIGLPLLLAAYMHLFRGDYFRPMYTTSTGIWMLALTAVSMTIGALWMNKLIKVEV